MPTSSRDRAYSAPPALTSLGMAYAWSATYVNSGGGGNPVTGGWIPQLLGADGSLLISATNLSFSGTAIVVQDSVVSAISSGNATLTTISNTATTLNTIETSGVKYNAATSGYLAAISSSVSSGIPIYTLGASTVSNSTISGAANTMVTGQILAANPNRIMWYVQNISPSSPLYVKYGAGAVGPANFNLLLHPFTSGYAGNSWTDNDARWRGAISASGQGQFIAWEL